MYRRQPATQSPRPTYSATLEGFLAEVPRTTSEQIARIQGKQTGAATGIVTAA